MLKKVLIALALVAGLMGVVFAGTGPCTWTGCPCQKWVPKSAGSYTCVCGHMHF